MGDLKIILGILIPFFGTALGALCVLLVKGKLDSRVGRGMAGFAAGVMVAASVWSLLIPAVEQARARGGAVVLPVMLGFGIGFFFLLLLDLIVPQPADTDCGTGEGRLRKTYLMVLAVTLHNLPEGMAVGVVFAAVAAGEGGVGMSAAMALSVGIAVQNFPEGAIVSLPLRAAGVKKGRALALGVLSGVVELAGAVLMLFAAVHIVGAMPFLLAFAAGAMIYVTAEELIPEMHGDVREKLGAISFCGGFLLMMVLDVAFG